VVYAIKRTEDFCERTFWYTGSVIPNAYFREALIQILNFSWTDSDLVVGPRAVCFNLNLDHGFFRRILNRIANHIFDRGPKQFLTSSDQAFLRSSQSN